MSALFDTSEYVKVEPIDGLERENVTLRFGGTIELTPDDPNHAKFVDRLKLGRKVLLQIEGNVAGKQDVVKYDTDMNEHVTHTLTVRIDGIDTDQQ